MLDELIALLPAETGSAALAVAIFGVLIGLSMWVAGARFSRPLLTLSAVTLGGVLGLQMPRWFGWNVSGAGPAVGSAVVLGVWAYVLHRMWVGMTLGLVLCAWTFFATWILLRNSQSLNWPGLKDGDVFGSLATFWQSLPVDVTRILPYIWFVAMVSGLAMAILWDRFTLLLTWSAAGATLLIVSGIATIEHISPALLKRVPTQAWIQATTVFGLIAIGALVQTRSTPRRAPAPAGKPPKSDKPAKSSKE